MLQAVLPYGSDRRLHMEKSNSRETQRTPKRHCRPISGSAPFVICNNCLQLLQLPLDFVVAKGRRRKLRCGACLEVLTFLSIDGLRVAPLKVSQLDFPPGEAARAQKTSMEADHGEEMKGYSLHQLMGYASVHDLVYYLPGDED